MIMCAKGSVIPHLARIIAERRLQSQWQHSGVASASYLARTSRALHDSSARQRPALAQKPQRAPTLRSPRPPPVSPPTPTAAEPLSDFDVSLNRKGRRLFAIALGFACFVGVYVSYVGASWTNEIKKHAEEKGVLPQNSDVSDRWRQLGRNYDDEVELAEKFFNMDIVGKRKKLVSQAYGKVLEVSAGTGRNFPYYDLAPFDATRATERHAISSLTINDQSSVMIATAESKFEVQQEQAARPFTGQVDFVTGDAGIRGVIQRPEGGYDTIIETMGLCSMVDPVGFLRTMGTLCRQPGEASSTAKMQLGADDGKGGKILLLEHGRSEWSLVNKVLDSGASMHADHYGCWWNKDIMAIIKMSGLEVEHVRRYHFGTTWEIQLRPTMHRR